MVYRACPFGAILISEALDLTDFSASVSTGDTKGISDEPESIHGQWIVSTAPVNGPYFFNMIMRYARMKRGAARETKVYREVDITWQDRERYR